MSLPKLDPKKKHKPKDLLEDLKQKYISAPNEKLRKFYADMIKAKGGVLPKL